jgi:transcriptional regulator with XRE-family HTH domain
MMEVIKGSDLKLLLKRKGLTQEFISESLGINRSQISRYFTDDVVPTYPFVIKVAALAGLSIDDLIKHDKKEVKAFNEPQAAYHRTEKPEVITIDNLGTIIREMQNKIQDLQKDLKVLKEKEKRKEFA